MDWPLLLLAFVAGLLWVYMILLFLRLLSGWFSMDANHPALRLLARICDPYLAWFRRFKWMTFGRFDFSPLLAILVVSFVANIFQMILQYGHISVGIVLAILIQMVWSAIQYFLGFFFILFLVRFLSLKLHWNGQAVWDLLDSVVMPVTQRVATLLGRGRFFPYPSALILSAVVFAVLFVGGSLGVSFVAGLVASVPL